MRHLLLSLEESIDSRFALYTCMRAQAGASRFEDAALCGSKNIRTALLARAPGGQTETCKGLLDQERPGVTCFCEARDAFALLAGN